MEGVSENQHIFYSDIHTADFDLFQLRTFPTSNFSNFEHTECNKNKHTECNYRKVSKLNSYSLILQILLINLGCWTLIHVQKKLPPPLHIFKKSLTPSDSAPFGHLNYDHSLRL